MEDPDNITIRIDHEAIVKNIKAAILEGFKNLDEQRS